jgi:hypothetical protein
MNGRIAALEACHIRRVKPKLSVHGHIHGSYGRYVLEHMGNTTQTTLIANASVLDEEYRLVNKPIMVEIVDGQFKWVQDEISTIID